MAVPLKYVYFNLRGRGELPRLVAAVGKVKVEEQRVTLKEWREKPELKKNAPYGQVPYLIVGDKTFAQNLAISLYFARKSGLYPAGSSSPEETLAYDHVVYFLEDIAEQIIVALVDKTFKNKPETLTNLKADILPQKLPKVEALLKQSGTGFFVGNKLSIVDLSAFEVMEHVVEEMGADFLKSFPLTKAHFERVAAIPEIKKHVQSRPPFMSPELYW